MKRVNWLPLFLLFAAAGVRAQTIVGVTISLEQNNQVIAGPNFYVDGQLYSGSQTFPWPVGSKHILQFPFSVDPQGNTLGYQIGNGGIEEWSFSGWTGASISSDGSPYFTLTVQPGLTSVVGNISSSGYQLTITFPPGTGSQGTNANCSGAPGPPSSTNSLGWGLVYIDGACISDSSTQFALSGPHTLSAFPFPGYDFVGFESGGNPPNPAFSTFNMITPLQISAIFTQAKRVNFRTNPVGLQLIIDQTTILTPATSATSIQQTTFHSQSCPPNVTALPPVPTTYYGQILCTASYDFLPQSSHRIGAPPAQQDGSGLWWVFNGFDDGLGQNGTYLADANLNYPDTVTGTFIPGMQTAIVTVPAGLKIAIDGTAAWPGYNFVWGQGTAHTLAAPATQVDSSGRTWQFAGWSNGGAASQTVTVPSSGQAFSVTATYTELGQVQVTSTPPGLTFTVGGSNCTTPCAVSQASGSQIQVAAPASVPYTMNARYDFTGWSNGGGSSPSLQVTFTQGVQTFNASYQTSYLLTVASSPANDAAVKTSPASPDGYFPAGTQISVMPAAASGYKFLGWGGDLSGTLTPGYLTMNSPHSVMVYVNAAPGISPAGIINAAGPTPDGSVAPGSIISIYGQNLASAPAIGPTNPFSQSIGNVTVTVNNILMPLIFVSPGQINAQVPVELAAGAYALTVQSVGQQPVSGSLTVSRNAPGIFTQANAQNLPLAAATHQDGSLITPSSPARRKEIVSFYGTGIGPLQTTVPDGFPAPLAPLDPSVDTVTINAGGVTVPAIWAGAAPALTGMDIVQLQIVDSIPSATTINVVVTVNGKPSAAVQLPVQ